MTDTMTLWRPTGPQELALVRASGWAARPARRPDQPIFYPVLNEQYAIKIAREWNVPASGVGARRGTRRVQPAHHRAHRGRTRVSAGPLNGTDVGG